MRKTFTIYFLKRFFIVYKVFDVLNNNFVARFSFAGARIDTLLFFARVERSAATPRGFIDKYILNVMVDIVY